MLYDGIFPDGRKLMVIEPGVVIGPIWEVKDVPPFRMVRIAEGWVNIWKQKQDRRGGVTFAFKVRG